jgi:cation diffusion facilitator family transporter
MGLQDSDKGIGLSIAAYVLLSALKIFIGYSSGSDALAADGFNNATDIVASIAVLIGLRLSRKPADHDHRYGHHRAETIAALVASFIMMSVGLQVLYDSVRKLSHPIASAPDPIAAWVALFCAAVMFAVYAYNIRIAGRMNSQAMRAAAKDNLSDAIVSVGAFVAIVGSIFGLPWLDLIAAIVVGIVICRTAWDIFRDATHALTDGFNADELKRMKDTIRSIKGVKDIVDIRARLLGNLTFVDVTVSVNPHLSVVESHDITETIEETVSKQHNVSNVHIHIEPYRAATK